MLYVQVNDKGDAIERPISIGALRLRFPNLVIPDEPTQTFLTNINIKKVGMQPNPQKLPGHYIVLGIPETNPDGTMKRTFEQVPYTETGLRRRQHSLKQRCNAMLSMTDWTQTADVQENMTEVQRNEWNEYRATLRNMVIENEDPDMVVFPKEPDDSFYNHPTNNPTEKAKRASAAMFSDIQTDGYEYKFPDGSTGVIQTRDTKDLINIIGVAIRAMLANSTGDDFETYFRTKDDVNHKLNSKEAMIMALSVFDNIQNLYAKKWKIASQIENNPDLNLSEAWNERTENS